MRIDSLTFYQILKSFLILSWSSDTFKAKMPKQDPVYHVQVQNSCIYVYVIESKENEKEEERESYGAGGDVCVRQRECMHILDKALTV